MIVERNCALCKIIQAMILDLPFAVTITSNAMHAYLEELGILINHTAEFTSF